MTEYSSCKVHFRKSLFGDTKRFFLSCCLVFLWIHPTLLLGIFEEFVGLDLSDEISLARIFLRRIIAICSFVGFAEVVGDAKASLSAFFIRRIIAICSFVGFAEVIGDTKSFLTAMTLSAAGV
jgi:hypothetical protein